MKVATLQIKVVSDQVAQATKRLDALESQGKRAERATDGLRNTFAKTALVATATGVALGAIGLGLAALYKVVQVTKEFGQLSAMLKTSTGSAENAEIAFKAIQEFAANTPFDLQQATTAFIKLVNYGLNPSTEALTAWGDFASAQGKDLVQSIEAVADAAVGNWTRMKETFGVVGEKVGDNIKITFRGVTTTVKDEAAIVEATLLKLAQDNFGGAMADQMGELGGVLSNLGDAWDTIFLNISRQGLGEVITKGLRMALDALNEVNAQLASGQLPAQIDANAHLWGNLFEGIAAAAKQATPRIATETGLWGDDIEEIAEIAKKTFEYFPVIVGTSMKLAANGFNVLSVAGELAAKTTVKLMLNELDRLVSGAQNVAARAAAALQGNFNQSIFDFASGVNNATFDANRTKILEDSATAYKDLITETADTAKTAFKEAETAIIGYEKGLIDAERLRDEFNNAKPDGKDKLGQFGIKPSGPSSADAGGGSGGGGGGKSDLDSLIESLRTEEEAITASYEARMLTVQTYTAAGSEQRAMLSAQVITATEEEMLKLSDMRAADFEGQMNAFTLIEDSLAESYQRRREIILENTQITEDQKLSLLTKAETAYTAQVRKLEASRNKVILDGTLQFFNDVASIGTAFGEKGFKIAKAAAIASATIAMWESATKAYNNGVAAGGSYYGVALGTVWAAGAVAAGTANIAKISATQYAGAYEHGGMIGAGQVGLVGEAGPELVTGPAMVRSARSTADMGAGRSEAAPVIVNVYNLPGQEVETRQTTGPNGEQQLDVIIKKVEQKFAGDAMNGGGSFVPAMAKAFHLSRA